MSDNIEKLKLEWDKYSESWNAKNEYNAFMKKYPEENLENMKLEEYTNIKSNEETEYFTHWLERKTENCGKFRTASSFAYGVYKVNDNNINEKKYKEEKEFAKDKYRSLEQKKHDNENYKTKYISEKDAEEYFIANVKPIIVNLSRFSDIETIKPLDINYARKIAYMYNIDKLIPIYKKEVLKEIANFFEIEDLDLNSYKVTENILEKIKESFEIDKEITFELSQKIASFLWKNFGESVSLDSKNIIFYGAPGTGKTYTVQNTVKQRILKSGDNLDDVALFTQFHPSFGYEDFIEGLKPHIKNGATELKLISGIFKKFCHKAIKNLKEARENDKDPKSYYFIADEINRAELSTVFGELLVCLEENKRIDFDKNGKLTEQSMTINTQYSYLYTGNDGIIPNSTKFGVPSNLYFIGTMNDIDRSIDSFDLALRRRFIWERMNCNYEALANCKELNEIDDIQPYIEICKDLNNYISKTLGLGKSYEIGHSYFMEINLNQKKITKVAIKDLFEKKLKPLIAEYLRSEYSETDIESKLEEAEKKFKL